MNAQGRDSYILYCLRALLAVTIVSVIFGTQGSASPYVIHRLDHDVLLDASSSRQELAQHISLHEARVRAAAIHLGLTTSQYQAFRARLSKAQYVVIPRHLNSMVGYAHGSTYVLRDIIIPSDTRGWEVDLTNGRQLTRIFVPALCGNLSILRTLTPNVRLAAVKHSRMRRAPRMAVGASSEAATPMPRTTQTPIAAIFPAAAPHKVSFIWGLLLLPIALIHGGGGHSSTPPGLIIPIVPPTPTPVPTKTPCPTPTPKPTATPCPTKTPGK